MESATILESPCIRLKRYSVFHQNPIFLKDQNTKNLLGQKCCYLGLITVLLNPDLSFFKKEKKNLTNTSEQDPHCFHSDWRCMLTAGMLQVNRIKIEEEKYIKHAA